VLVLPLRKRWVRPPEVRLRRGALYCHSAAKSGR
jgi:hypothetical protein